MDAALLDTDILTEIFKGRNSTVRGHAATYLKTYGQFTISAFTQFEVVRGLRFKGATTKLQAFETLCQSMAILPVANEVLNRAADPWATGRSGGHPHRDADLIIATTALEHGQTLVTGNTADFHWIAGLKLEDWRQA